MLSESDETADIVDSKDAQPLPFPPTEIELVSLSALPEGQALGDIHIHYRTYRRVAPQNAPLFFVGARAWFNGKKAEASQAFGKCRKMDPKNSYGRQAGRILELLRR